MNKTGNIMKILNNILMKNTITTKVIVFILCLIPLSLLFIDMITNNMGANPVEKMTRFTGKWGLIFLLITLSITPLRKLFQLPVLLKVRRMLGLYSFFYLLLHFLIWFWLDHNFDTIEMLKDVAKRPFILAGFSAFILMIPLALTSFNKAIKWLGGKNWQRLHYLIYLIASLAILHYYWMKSAKNNVHMPIVYGTILLVLLLLRPLLKKYHFFNKTA